MKPLLPLILLAAPLCAQAPRVALPVGARVKIDNEAGGQTIEGTVLAWRRDTLLVQPQDRGDTVRVAPDAVKKLRIVESPALWRYTSAGEINFHSSADLPRPRDRTSAAGDAYDRLLLVGTKTELAGVNAVTGAVVWTRKDLADLKGVSLDVAWNTGFAIITRRDTMEIIDLRTGLKRWDSGSLSFLAARGWLPSPAVDTAMLILGRTAGSASTLMAVDVASGKMRWRQDSAFRVGPKVFESGGVSQRTCQSPCTAFSTPCAWAMGSAASDNAVTIRNEQRRKAIMFSRRPNRLRAAVIRYFSRGTTPPVRVKNAACGAGRL